MLANFSNLQFIDASQNYISTLKLSLKHLKTLILSRNEFVKIPNLINFPNLEELDLSDNKVTEMKLSINQDNYINFRVLKLNNNKIDFSNQKAQLFEFIDKLKMINNLEQLDVQDNLIDEDSLNQLIGLCQSQTKTGKNKKEFKLNGETKQYYDNQVRSELMQAF